MFDNFRASRFSAVFLLFLFLIASCTGGKGPDADKEQNIPKNIILLIGDGMSYPQVAAAWYEFGGLNMTGMPYTGSAFTHSLNNRVTDSAAAGTALSTGYKTNSGMVAQLPDGTPLETIAQYASSLGKSTAIMASVRVTHATPAVFGVHHPDRGEEFDIAEKFVDSGIDMLLGAGWNYFLPEGEGGEREDGRNLIAEMEEKGYVYIDDEENIDQIAGNDRVIAFLRGANLQRYPQRGDQMNRLTVAALEQLSQNPEGFFIMIEGAMIDWGGHANDAEYVLQETKDFDNVVGDALEFAKNDGNTLVIVTADHETGGMTLNSGSEGGHEYGWTTGGHTALPVPVYTYGPSAEKFTGTYHITDVARKMFSLWGKELE
ncbi:alkaline phosphatase [Balneolales bacterium ANBcel1]|nr:alkaline phosphatase [Balneolales bacterium ANBcel1]